VTALGTQVVLARAHEAFDAEGKLREERVAQSVRALAAAVAKAAAALRG
jgi:ABC-type uncharacterized transport system auxiliary subunit